MEYLTKRLSLGDANYNPNAIIRCVTITRSDGSGGYVCPLADAVEFLDTEVMTDPEVGESITVTHCLKTQLELDNMPEFDGW